MCTPSAHALTHRVPSGRGSQATPGHWVTRRVGTSPLQVSKPRWQKRRRLGWRNSVALLIGTPFGPSSWVKSLWVRPRTPSLPRTCSVPLGPDPHLGWWRGPRGLMGSVWTSEPPRICAVLSVAEGSVTLTLLMLLHLPLPPKSSMFSGRLSLQLTLHPPCFPSVWSGWRADEQPTAERWKGSTPRPSLTAS